MAQLGRNADGEVLEPGRVPDCYIDLLLDPTDHDTEAAGVLVVTPAALLHPQVSPAGRHRAVRAGDRASRPDVA